jgi:hypothetical protein
MKQAPDNRYTREWYTHLRSAQSVGEFERELFAWYQKESEAMLERLQAEEVKYIQEQVAAGYEDLNDSGLLATDYQARRVRYSHVIYLASMLETVLKRECHRLALALGDQGAPFSPAEIRGDQWTSKKKFLERFGHFEIPDTMWSPVRHLTTVRNILVHDNGAADLSSSASAATVRGIPGIRESAGELEVGAEFVADAFASACSLIDYLRERVSEVIELRLRPKHIE